MDFVGYSVRSNPASGSLDYYLVTRYVSTAVTLEWALANRHFSSRDIHKIAVQVTRAVMHLHAHGFCSNDIGACNVLVQKLLDHHF